MHSAIFFVRIPASRSDWGIFLDYTKLELEQGKGVLRLAENVWLLNVQESPEPLARLVACAADCKLPYMLLPLADQPRWLPADSDPKTIRGRSA